MGRLIIIAIEPSRSALVKALKAREITTAPTMITIQGAKRVCRKALISRKRREIEDPFPARKNLATRKFYTLDMHIHALDSETGTPVYDRKFKESRAYTNPNQTALFAFYDLAFEVKEKFFREITGGERLQVRYLIIR